MAITHNTVEYKSGVTSPEDDAKVAQFKAELTLIQNKALEDIGVQSKPLLEKYGFEGEILADLNMVLLIMPKLKEEEKAPPPPAVETHPDAHIILAPLRMKDFVRSQVERQPLDLTDLLAHQKLQVIMEKVDSCCDRHVSFEGLSTDGKWIRGKLDVQTGIGAIVFI